MIDFSRRSGDAEIMDDLEYAGEMMDRTLGELEVINRWLGGNRVTINGISKLLEGTSHNDLLRVVDLGCGRGDMLILIDGWSKRYNLKLELLGIDANHYVINAARKRLSEFPHIQLQSINILSPDFQKEKFDIVIGTLFYHHFTDEQLIAFFSKLKKQAEIGFLINDIHRHSLAYYSIKLLTVLFSRSSMVKYDAPLSVLRAFSRSELSNILRSAGIENFTIKWKWAFRWQVIVFSDPRN
ncbi:MAG TPA: methyltransferase domain-containing protein [Chryseolinea sp.]|nr:methyltransferase domain-containing protein [Chryseolinea sp.]